MLRLGLRRAFGLIPMVVEQTSRGERSYDIFSRLLKERIVCDIAIHAREILEARDRLNRIYVKHTGQNLEKIEQSTDRDNFMSPEEAKDFGLIDEVIERRPLLLISDKNTPSDLG